MLDVGQFAPPLLRSYKQGVGLDRTWPLPIEDDIVVMLVNFHSIRIMLLHAQCLLGFMVQLSLRCFPPVQLPQD